MSKRVVWVIEEDRIFNEMRNEIIADIKHDSSLGEIMSNTDDELVIKIKDEVSEDE